MLASLAFWREIKNIPQIPYQRETPRAVVKVAPLIHHREDNADLCVFPHALLPKPRMKSAYELSAANGTVIATYRTITLPLNLGLRRDFTWRFVVADVVKPIIGADFLAHYGLLVDIRNQRLHDQITQLTSTEEVTECAIPSVKIIAGCSAFHELLQWFPDVTHPDETPNAVKHSTRHHIVTTPGPPIAQRPRRLAPDRLQAARKEFDAMVQLGIARSSQSSCTWCPRRATNGGHAGITVSLTREPAPTGTR